MGKKKRLKKNLYALNAIPALRVKGRREMTSVIRDEVLVSMAAEEVNSKP